MGRQREEKGSYIIRAADGGRDPRRLLYLELSRRVEEIDDVEKRRLALGMLSDVVRGPAGAAA